MSSNFLKSFLSGIQSQQQENNKVVLYYFVLLYLLFWSSLGSVQPLSYTLVIISVCFINYFLKYAFYMNISHDIKYFYRLQNLTKANLRIHFDNLLLDSKNTCDFHKLLP